MPQDNDDVLEYPILYSGFVVQVTDPTSPMLGWRGVVTSPLMWPTPKYKPIPSNHYRIEMDSGEGLFYGDYARNQLKVLRQTRRVYPRAFDSD